MKLNEVGEKYVQSSIIIPQGLQIVMDDLGWFCGLDDRKNGAPSRTGMPRYHVAEDYAAVNELGHRLNMKINCAFVIGEWDFDNRLRKIPHLSKYGDGWDNAAHLDTDELRRCIGVINASEYIDIAIHGLLHGYYMQGTDNHDTSDYYYHMSGKLVMVPEGEIRARLDEFLGLLRDCGIKKEINTFVPPSFAYRTNELSGIIADYGIKFNSTIFECADSAEKLDRVIIEDGIITVDRINNLIEWDEATSDPGSLPETRGIFGCHWPNLLHEDPQRHSEVIEKWVAYFEKCADAFGVVLSRDMKFFATQALFEKYAKISENGGEIKIDISQVPRLEACDKSFVISSKMGIADIRGGKVELLQKRKGFLNYLITPGNDDAIIAFARK